MKTSYTVLIERDEAGWLVSEVVGLPGCHTQAKSMKEFLLRTKEAIEGYLKADSQPSMTEFVGVHQIEM